MTDPSLLDHSRARTRRRPRRCRGRDCRTRRPPRSPGGVGVARRPRRRRPPAPPRRRRALRRQHDEAPPAGRGPPAARRRRPRPRPVRRGAQPLRVGGRRRLAVLPGPGRRPGRRDLGRGRRGSRSCASSPSTPPRTRATSPPTSCWSGWAPARWPRCSATPAARTPRRCPAASRTPRARGGLDNVVTAADLGLVLRGVAARTLAPESTCAEIEAVLARQEHRDGSRRGCRPRPTSPTRPAGSTGSTTTWRWCVPRTGPPYVLVVLTTVDLPDESASALIADVSRTVWEGWRPMSTVDAGDHRAG